MRSDALPWNVLFIAVDDLCSVDDQLRILIPGHDLPNLRRLKSSGTTFRRACSTVPVCGPARAALMTGLSPAETGVLSNHVEWRDCGIRPEHAQNYRFRQAGYWCGTAGKIFHGYGPQPQPIHDTLYDSPRFRVTSWVPPTPVSLGGAEGRAFTGDESRFYDHQMASLAIEHLHNHQGDRPWYFELGFYKPHTPYDAPLWCYEAVDWRDVQMPEAWKDGWTVPPFLDEWMIRSLQKLTADPASWTADQLEYWQKSVRNYAAAALWFDHNLGRVLDALDASRFADSTIVSLYSDHGYHLGEQGHWHKFTLYEAASRAPMVIRVPGRTPREIDIPVQHHDIFATLHDYCAIVPHAGTRGRSLRRLIETGADPDLAARSVPSFWYGLCSIAWGDHRAILSGDGSLQIFDVRSDIWLQNDLSADADLACEARERLLATMQEWGWSLVGREGALSQGASLGSHIEGAARHDEALLAPVSVVFGSELPSGIGPHCIDLWLRSWRSAHVDLPVQVRDVTMAIRAPAIAIRGNDRDGHLYLSEWYTGTLDLYTGRGSRVFGGTRGNARIRTGPGNNRIHMICAGRRSEIWLGAGDDVVTSSAGSHVIHARHGSNRIRLGGKGSNEIHCGHGRNSVTGGLGDDLFHVGAGTNRIDPGGGRNRIVLTRTGMPQVLLGLDAGTCRFDMSDFVGLRPAWQRISDRVHLLQCNDEQIRFEGLTIEAIKAAIEGWADGAA